ncbi:MAG: DUF2169 domain-containing protein [Paraburkholderia sp.]|uniref:DUF2169 family type VI secretion system accessory protein n=1 Tax=Paraburkholderia sp. TaxID=1926495 RepID=UPI003C50A7E7
MQFLNLTPFDTMCFNGLDLEDGQFHVVVMKVGYELLPTDVPGNFVAQTVKEPVPLCLRDEYHGAVNESSVREESDLAHYKPRCDVIVRGSAHAPHGTAATQWGVRIKVSSPRSSLQTISQTAGLSAKLDLKPALDARYGERWMIPLALSKPLFDSITAPQVLLDKTLQIVGPREYHQRLAGWSLSTPQATARVPLRWEYAFGGSSVVRNPRHGQDPEAAEFLLNEVCFSNPLGCGWVENRYSDMLRKAGQKALDRLPAPQIEFPERPVQRPVMIRHPDQFDATNPDEFIRIAQGYDELPAGLGIVGRSWVPRLQMAGTYDARWQRERWPLLPDDFDFGYWNCAPRDQQIEALPPDACLELWNLVDPALAPEGYLRVDLPGDWPLVYLHQDDGLCLPLPMTADTLLVDTDAMTLTLTHRFQFIRKSSIERVEARVRRLIDTSSASV